MTDQQISNLFTIQPINEDQAGEYKNTFSNNTSLRSVKNQNAVTSDYKDILRSPEVKSKRYRIVGSETIDNQARSSYDQDKTRNQNFATSRMRTTKKQLGVKKSILTSVNTSKVGTNNHQRIAKISNSYGLQKEGSITNSDKSLQNGSTIAVEKRKHLGTAE